MNSSNQTKAGRNFVVLKATPRNVTGEGGQTELAITTFQVFAMNVGPDVQAPLDLGNQTNYFVSIENKGNGVDKVEVRVSGVPEGYNATTVLNYALKVDPGAETYLDFGAQLSSQAMAEAPTPQGSGVSPVLGILGLAMLVGGVGVAVYAARLSRSNNRRTVE